MHNSVGYIFLETTLHVCIILKLPEQIYDDGT